jgi:oligopeptidase A
MKHKLLNIIALIVLAVVAAVLVVYIKGNCMNTNLGYFPDNALENAIPRVNDAVKNARIKIEDIANNPDKTYMNFVRALMDVDAELDAVTNPIGHLDSVNHSEETQKIMEATIPVLSEFASDMSRHKGLYQGYLYIKQNEYNSLTVAQKKLVDDAIRNFEIAGVNLPSAKQARLKEIASKLSKLSNDFKNNVIAANQKFKISITDESKLGEMPDSDRAVAKTEKGFEFSLLDPSYIAFMTYVTDRGMREKMYHARVTRAPENEKLIPEILALRQEMAKILGYKNIAELIFEDRAAESPKLAQEFLNNLAIAAKPFAQKDWAELQDRAELDGINDLQPWDNAYYSRIVQKEKYDISDAETKPYFELNATVKKMLEIMQEAFNVKFVARGVRLWHADAMYYDVVRDGRVIAGFYTDLTARETKSPGAHEQTYHYYYKDAAGAEHLPEVFIVANFPPQKDGMPSLLTMDNIRTLFHETGHAMMDLLSRVDERALSGNNVDWDVVEFPSQFLESFWNSPDVLKRLGTHYKTGKKIPDDLIVRIKRADNFQRGMFVARQLEFGIFDLDVHTRHNLSAADVQKSLDNTRSKVAIVPYMPYDKFQNAFLHIFAGGYAAGYYSYLWADVLAVDAYMAFNGNLFNKELAHKYRDIVLVQGGSKKMDEIYREFIGRDPRPESLLEFYGLTAVDK